MDVEAAHKEFQRDFKKFFDDTKGEDQLQVIIRGHLYIEHEIDKLLHKKLKHPEHVFTNNFMFNGKLNWSLALGLIPDEHKTAYSKFNTIRNKFAHNLNYQLTK